MKEKTMVLIKPHILSGKISPACARYTDRVVADILGRYLEAGLHLEKIKSFQLYGRQINELYRQHFGKGFFSALKRDMTNGHCIAMIWSGERAVKVVRRLNGATRVTEAEAGTIRHKYGDRNNLSNNAVHSSESVEAARREIELIFGKNH